MSRKHFSFLAIALVLVLGAILLLLPGQTGQEPGAESAGLLEGYAARVNDIDRVSVVGPGDAVLATLVRGDEAWRVEELSGYPADLAVLREVLGGLAEAEVIEPKTANPDYYARLGVEDVTSEGAGGLRLDLSAGADSWSVIVGDEAPNRGGHYLREAGAAASVLADFTADVPATASGWADATVIDLMAGEVAEVQLTRPDGETLTAHKVSADQSDFSLLELPEGREKKSAWAVNSLGSALSTLDMESVQPLDAIDWTGAIALRAVRFDGLEVNGQLVRLGEAGDWLRLEASAPFAGEATDNDAGSEAPAQAESVGEPEAAPAEDVADGPEGIEAVPDDAPNPSVAAAEAINARVGGWAYRIPAFKAEAMDKRLEDLLKPLADASPDAP